MDRFTLLVDAGYFFAVGSEAAFGVGVRRRDFRLTNPRAVLSQLEARAGQLCGNLPLLRTYWYDAMPGATLSPDQAELAQLSSLKLRLGVLNGAGQQKGVDSLIVTDLVELARNRAVADAVVVSGDEDVRIGVQLAQSNGLRIHLLGAGDVRRNMSSTLRQEADTVDSLEDVWFEEFFEMVPGESAKSKASTRHASVSRDIGVPEPSQSHTVSVLSVEGESLEDAAQRVAEALLKDCDRRDIEQIKAQVEMNRRVPSVYDRPLIGAVSKLFGGERFTPDQCRSIRSVFMDMVRSRGATRLGLPTVTGLLFV